MLLRICRQEDEAAGAEEDVVEASLRLGLALEQKFHYGWRRSYGFMSV